MCETVTSFYRVSFGSVSFQEVQLLSLVLLSFGLLCVLQGTLNICLRLTLRTPEDEGTSTELSSWQGQSILLNILIKVQTTSLCVYFVGDIYLCMCASHCYDYHHIIEHTLFYFKSEIWSKGKLHYLLGKGAVSCCWCFHIDRWMLWDGNQAVSTGLADVLLQLLLHFYAGEELGRQPAPLPAERRWPGRDQQRVGAGPFTLQVYTSANQSYSQQESFLQAVVTM